jgi:polar amino acid transport system substrate-binding protein
MERIFMRALKAVALACTIVLGAAASALGQDAIKVYTADLPPWSNVGNKAKPGFAYEVMVEMAKRSGLKIEFETVAWRRAQEEVKTRPNTMVFHLFRTPDREPHYSWQFSLLDSNVVFVSTRKVINSVDEAKALTRVVVLAGTPQESDMKQAGARNVEVVDEVESAIRMLERDRVDAFFTIAERAIYAWSEAKFPPDKLLIGKPLRVDPLFVASNGRMPDGSMAKLKSAFDGMKSDGTYTAIRKKYFGDSGKSA